MARFIVLFLIFFNFSFANSLGLTKTDLVILNKIKSLADEPIMKYSLMAIAIKESSVGKNMANFSSNDFGLFQSNIKTVLSRQYIKDTPQNRKYYALKLMNDVGFATANAIVEIDYWKKVHNNNWVRIWASYNAGWRYRSTTGIIYANSIFDIMKKLRFEYNL